MTEWCVRNESTGGRAMRGLIRGTLHRGYTVLRLFFENNVLHVFTPGLFLIKQQVCLIPRQKRLA